MTDDELIWVDERDVLALHDQLLVFHGGAEGLRDEGLPPSALARPRQLAAYGGKADIVEMATAYTAGIVRNHRFIDGNKRVGFVAGILFLEINGYSFSAAEAVLALAADALDEAGYGGRDPRELCRLLASAKSSQNRPLKSAKSRK